MVALKDADGQDKTVDLEKLSIKKDENINDEEVLTRSTKGVAPPVRFFSRYLAVLPFSSSYNSSLCKLLVLSHIDLIRSDACRKAGSTRSSCGVALSVRWVLHF